jgi:UDP-glucuronate 4-epimerase
MKVLITGVAGFIGYHLAQRLLLEDNEVYGVDNLNDYYDVNLKQARLNRLLPQKQFTFDYLHLSDRSSISQLFQQYNFDIVRVMGKIPQASSQQPPYRFTTSVITTL